MEINLGNMFPPIKEQRECIKWYGKTNNEYTIVVTKYPDGHKEYSCNCPSCRYDNPCWKVKQLEYSQSLQELRIKYFKDDSLDEARIKGRCLSFVQDYQMGRIKLIGHKWERVC